MLYVPRLRAVAIVVAALASTISTANSRPHQQDQQTWTWGSYTSWWPGSFDQVYVKQPRYQRRHARHHAHKHVAKEVMRNERSGASRSHAKDRRVHVTAPRPASVSAGAVPLPPRKPVPLPVPRPKPIAVLHKPDIEEQGFLNAWRNVTAPIRAAGNIFKQFVEHLTHVAVAPTDKLPVTLKVKLAEIQNACTGFKVISTVCGAQGHSLYVRGTSRISLHCLNRAADFIVDRWSCAYSHLAKWTGGLSIDPNVVNHIHISKGGREDGVRFCHHGCHHRYAKRHHPRVAGLSPFAMVRI